tara:strand:+ start:210 stop:1550 length:1341 start_codon:yes stop_codon:yes gene_type:complete
MKMFFTLAAACGMVLLQATVGFAQGRTVTRVFWQDDSTAAVRYGDLKRLSDGWSIEPESIPGFPALDVTEQSLVQMHSDAGVILLGVRDQAAGEFGSGWIAIDSGAEEESHGDHSHWRLNKSPSVLKSLIGTDQGNPAHVYKYGETFVLANDSKNGFTTTTTAQLRAAKTAEDAAKFYAGGNSHITLAVVDDQVAYATWIAREGEDSGRVDVVKLGTPNETSYAIHCPTGVLHGATANSGRVFFAPADGVCWVDADLECDDDPESVDVHYLSLGTDEDDQPLRTGAFANLDNRVLFTAGKGEHAKLCWIDASSQSPSVESMAIELSAGESLTTPFAIKTRGGKSWVMMFREHAEQPEDDMLLVVDVDANKDGDWSDSKIHSEVAVGRSQIEGHSGHHEAALLPTKRHLLVSNPGDGTITLISTVDFSVVATFSVGGTPARLEAIGE